MSRKKQTFIKPYYFVITEMNSEVIEFLKCYTEEMGSQNAFAKMDIRDHDKQLEIIRIARDSGLVAIEPCEGVMKITDEGHSILN